MTFNEWWSSTWRMLVETRFIEWERLVLITCALRLKVDWSRVQLPRLSYLDAEWWSWWTKSPTGSLVMQCKHKPFKYYGVTFTVRCSNISLLLGAGRITAMWHHVTVCRCTNKCFKNLCESCSTASMDPAWVVLVSNMGRGTPMDLTI